MPAYEAIETCHYQVYVKRLQKAGQIRAKKALYEMAVEPLKQLKP